MNAAPTEPRSVDMQEYFSQREEPEPPLGPVFVPPKDPVEQERLLMIISSSALALLCAWTREKPGDVDTFLVQQAVDVSAQIVAASALKVGL